MRRNQVIIIAAGLVISAFLAFINIYIGGIAVILVGALAMSFQIMADSEGLVEIGVVLSEDARMVTVRNRGNLPIKDIHVALVPLDIEFETSLLTPDGRFDYRLPSMLHEAKAVAEYSDENGRRYQKTFPLSSTHTDDDLLKPAFPIFGWKNQK